MTTCTHCGGIFNWTETPEGHRPVNVTDQKFHWLTCKGFKKASKKRWKLKTRSRRLARRKERRAAKLNLLEVKPVKITGAGFVPVESDALPWEDEPISPKVDELLELGGQA